MILTALPVCPGESVLSQASSPVSFVPFLSFNVTCSSLHDLLLTSTAIPASLLQPLLLMALRACIIGVLYMLLQPCLSETNNDASLIFFLCLCQQSKLLHFIRWRSDIPHQYRGKTWPELPPVSPSMVFPHLRFEGDFQALVNIWKALIAAPICKQLLRWHGNLSQQMLKSVKIRGQPTQAAQLPNPHRKISQKRFC